MKCMLCGKEVCSLMFHLRSHQLSIFEYYTQHEKRVVPKCKICGDFAKIRNIGTWKFHVTCGKQQCIRQICIGRICSNEKREYCRRKRFEYLSKRTGKTAWERRNAGEMSYLEKWFYDNVIVQYHLCDSYDVVNEYPEYPYFLDFAFLNVKLDVELDGNCHFTNGQKRIDSDRKRDEALMAKGWSVFRISSQEINDETIQMFLKKLDDLTNGRTDKFLEKTMYRGSLRKFQPKMTPEKRRQRQEQRRIIRCKLRNLQPKIVSKKRRQRQEQRRKSFDDHEREKITLLLQSSIDFLKFGWVNQAAFIIGKKPQKVAKWMRRYVPEFYKTCFQKKVAGGVGVEPTVFTVRA